MAEATDVKAGKKADDFLNDGVDRPPSQVTEVDFPIDIPRLGPAPRTDRAAQSGGGRVPRLAPP